MNENNKYSRPINLSGLWALPAVALILFLGALSLKGCEQNNKERTMLIERGMVETRYGQWVPARVLNPHE